jgi:hypothetical protein
LEEGGPTAALFRAVEVRPFHADTRLVCALTSVSMLTLALLLVRAGGAGATSLSAERPSDAVLAEA